MKKIKKIGVWVLLSLFLQTAVLFYLDKFYFVTETDFKTTKIDESTKENKNKKEVEIVIPNKAKNINVSYDGKYVAYYDSDILYVVNTITGDKKQVEFDKDIKPSYYKWLPDINSMFIAEKKSAAKQDTLQFSNYDAEKDKKKDIEADHKGNSIFINLPDKQSEVEDIELSPLTNRIYIKIKHKSSKGSIYEMDVMAQIEKLNLNSYVTGKILTFSHEARMAYEDTINHKIWVTGINKAIAIKNVTNPVLIATDDESRLYIGQLENNKVKKIYYGIVKDSTDKWKSVDLNSAVDRKDIYVSADGTVFVNNNLKGTITNVSTGKEIAYEGNFLQLYDKGIVCIVDEKIKKISFN